MRLFIMTILATLLAGCSGTGMSSGKTSGYGASGGYGTNQQLDKDLYRGGSK